MEIPARIERAVSSAVAHRLETELGDRGLLLTADRLSAAGAETARLGPRLLARVVDQCYPVGRRGGEALVLEFDSDREAARVEGALAFGAVTATMLTPRDPDPVRSPASVELLGAMFNLAAGLVDGLCDADVQTGTRLLQVLQGRGLAGAAEERRVRGWLRAELPPALAADPTVAFTVDLLEAFFETLHAVYRDDEQLSRALGAQFDDALDAERRSVDWSAELSSREELIECSRRTSVFPFRIIQTLALGGDATAEPSAGILLGEAMWRIDDLVDLCQDARSGALNGVLLEVTELEDLLDSPEIARVAAQAAESLLAGLQLAGDGRATAQDQFLHFIQRYAGIAPRRLS